MARKFWLDQPGNPRKVRVALYVACALLFAADALYHKHILLDFEGWFGFYGLYGFGACVALVLIAKEMRKFVGRPEDYYGEPDEGPAGEPEDDR